MKKVLFSGGLPFSDWRLTLGSLISHFRLDFRLQTPGGIAHPHGEVSCSLSVNVTAPKSCSSDASLVPTKI